VGKVTLKTNGDETLSNEVFTDDAFVKSNVNEALNAGENSCGDEGMNSLLF
jgi:hypothetical protein